VFHLPAEFFSRRDEKVITMEMIGKVRRMKLREQLSNSEIARRTGLSRNTVKKWLQAPGDQAPKYQRGNSPTKLGAFEATLVQALEADARRPKHARRTARGIRPANPS
jgi:transposase